MSYFEKVAPVYAERSDKGVWRLFRQKERRAIFQELNLQSFDSVLEVGCGAGFYSREIHGRVERFKAIDSSRAMVLSCENQGISAEVASLQEFHCHQRFDKILSAGVCEFNADVKEFFSGLLRCIKPGGLIVVLAPPRNILGQIYKLWHVAQGCATHIHDLSRIEDHFSELRVVSAYSVTPVSWIYCLRVKIDG